MKTCKGSGPLQAQSELAVPERWASGPASGPAAGRKERVLESIWSCHSQKKCLCVCQRRSECISSPQPPSSNSSFPIRAGGPEDTWIHLLCQQSLILFFFSLRHRDVFSPCFVAALCSKLWRCNSQSEGGKKVLKAKQQATILPREPTVKICKGNKVPRNEGGNIFSLNFNRLP